MEVEDSGVMSNTSSVLSQEFSEKLKLKDINNDDLLGDDSRKKLVYFSFTHRDEHMEYEWRVLDPHHDDLNISTNTVTNRLSSPSYRVEAPPKIWVQYLQSRGVIKPTFYPPGLQEHRDYGITVCKSRMYVLGGCHRVARDLTPSKQVFTFDTATNRWVQPSDPNPPPSPMLYERFRPVIMSFGDKLYVFGSKPWRFYVHPLPTIPKDQWAEYCDLNTGVWHYLPSPPPDRLVELTKRVMPFHAVCHRRHLFIFCVPAVGIFSYDILSGKWTEPDTVIPSDPATTFLPIPFSSNLTVVGDVMFWHLSGTIFAYDIMAHSHGSLYTFPDAHHLFPTNCHPTASFLVHAGNGKLCLIWFQPEPLRDYDADADISFDSDDSDLGDPISETRFVHFHTFQIEINASRELSLVHCSSTSLETSSFQILTVSAV